MAFRYVLLSLSSLAPVVHSISAQTALSWPAASDELEDLMFLQTGYRARGFAASVTPCSSSPQGPSRITAAEWIRTAFHDVATANTYFGTGGLDASIAFELSRAENDGPGFTSTITTQAAFFGPRVTMSDIIALGMYSAVRSCGGPSIPVRYGRIDATRSGDSGVPQPQNPVSTFQNQFARLGFNTSDMIAAVACGHTIGGVHAASQPLIVQSGTVPNDYAHLDTTAANFDERVVKEFVTGNTKNPLVVGISRNSSRDSDNRVFQADGNVTINALADPSTFTTTCRNIMQRLIEIVPSTVNLSTVPLTVYEMKPYNIQLYIADGGQMIRFSGEARIRTTNRPSIEAIQIAYFDRNGQSACDSCSITASKVGDAAGFDDSFSFFTFSTLISPVTSISSFRVSAVSQGSSETFGNSGNGFPVADSLLLQYPQSCLTSSSSLTVAVAIRSAITGFPTLNIIVRTARSGSNPVPMLTTNRISLNASAPNRVGDYYIYNTTVSIDPSKAPTARFNVTLGSLFIPLQNVADLPTACMPLATGSNSPTTTSVMSTSLMTTVSGVLTTPTQTASTTTTSGQSPTSMGTFSSPGFNQFSTGATTTIQSMTSVTVSSTWSTSTSTSTSTSSPTAPTYTYVGCYPDSVSSRTFTAKYTSSSDKMDHETCLQFCSSYRYFGLEYGAECYCSSYLSASSSGANTSGSTSDSNSNGNSIAAPDTDCNMACSGNSTQICGAGDRLSVFVNNNAASGPTNSDTIDNGAFRYKGCYSDSVSARTLTGLRWNSDNMTLSSCAQFCHGYGYFGAEYAAECYCGNVIANTSQLMSEEDCGMVCSGNNNQLCGSADRLSLYEAVGV